MANEVVVTPIQADLDQLFKENPQAQMRFHLIAVSRQLQAAYDELEKLRACACPECPQRAQPV